MSMWFLQSLFFLKFVQKLFELFRDNSERKPPKHKKPRSSNKRFTHKIP